MLNNAYTFLLTYWPPDGPATTAVIPTGQLVLCACHTATAYVTINQFNHLGFSGNYTVLGLMSEGLHVAYTLYLHILYDS